MARKSKKDGLDDLMNAFAGIDAEGAGEARHRLTSGKSEDSEPVTPTVKETPEQTTPTAVTSEPAAQRATRNKGGRPVNEIKRAKTVLYLIPENVVAMKTRAVQQGARFSDVVDALIQYHLGDLTDEELRAVRDINKSKTS